MHFIGILLPNLVNLVSSSLMDLIDKGTHMEDAAGNKYAKSDSPTVYKKKKLKFRGTAFWDTVFGLYVEYRDGEKLTLGAICKQMKVSLKSVWSHADKNDWKAKADAIIKKRNAATSTTLTVNPAEMVASTLAAGQAEFRENVNDLLVRASQTVRKMNPKTYLNSKTKEVSEMVSTAQKVQGWQKDEEKPSGSAPVLNVAFLMAEGMKPVIVSPAT